MIEKESDKKTVALFTTLSFPIPAVCGGGVETLITNLLDVNEEKNKVRFLVSSEFNKAACKKKYSNSDIYYFKNGIMTSPVGIFLYLRWRWYCFFTKKNEKYQSKNNNLRMDFLTYQYHYIAKRRKVDVIVLENVLRLEKFAALKETVGEENVFYHLHWTRLGDMINRQAIPNSISISEYVKKEWIKEKPNFGKNYVVYNCIDVERFSTPVLNRDFEREKLGFAKQDFVVLFSGRFIPEKGVDKLLGAFEILNSKKEEKIKLLLIGSANYSSLESSDFSNKIINKAKQMDNVVYLGYVPNESIHLYYGISDALAVPSVWEEGAGLVAIEGMASGLPLIITQSGGMVEYVTDDCAIKLPIDEYLSVNLSKSIIKLAKNAERRELMGQAGRKRAENFSKENFYNDLIKAIIGE